ncbi:BRO family protein [Brenneria populi subsp. brevivirga]|uniref:BRO family protein n=1 Tax=Brenneria populi TaxID=1505588 RepID=A0ABU6JT13_9GAMM|nr:BRO family protein [Brenneria populi subsp. brevivirga]MEC5343678.1 BRO family protein [Brenneria populi Li et al. 2015]
MTTTLSFHNHQFDVVTRNNQPWLTAADLTVALEYADEKSILRIYSRHADEFSDSMAWVVKLTTQCGPRETRIFSLRGAHLIAMFARTAVAKEFRRWVLDILDREIENTHPSRTKRISDKINSFNWQMHVHNINAACVHLDYIQEAWLRELHPALKIMRSPLAASLYDRISDAHSIVNSVRGGLERASGLKGLQYK